ncbi:MAG TPA: DctP family TRAP transporter solute-binding subunit [Symbiobacteriaceae bacterium]|jgi:TRAP-type transport system periplasmic protein|nr:DctP family TRAP transporter solute-binding subunit [Symbiobacteriaceae bacterium]
MNRRSLLVSALALVTAVGLVATGCSKKDSQATTPAAGETPAATKSVTIRYAHFQPGNMDQPKHAAALAFKSYVEQNTKGAVKVEVFPASQLGDAGPVLEQVKLGSIQMAVVHDGPISSVYPPLGVYNLPFAFNNQGEAWSVFDSAFTKEIGADMLAKTGIRLMGLADNGVRHFTNSKREIKSPADMKDLKMRIQPSPLYEKLVQGTGASPSSIGWTELPSALQQKVVDGQENGVTNILAASLFQTQKYVTLSGHVYSYHAYLMSDKFFQSLTPDQQKVVTEGVELAKWIHRGMTANQDMNAEAILSAKGMTVTKLTPAEVDVFRQATQPAVAEWMKKEYGEKWVNGLQAAIKAAQGKK